MMTHIYTCKHTKQIHGPKKNHCTLIIHPSSSPKLCHSFIPFTVSISQLLCNQKVSGFIVEITRTYSLKWGFFNLYFSFFCVLSWLDSSINCSVQIILRASLVAPLVKNLPAMWETWVPSLDWEDPLEEGMATLQYSCLVNPHGQRNLTGYSPVGHKVEHD